jgi:uncharacterized protein YyaL (SSP411 family)
MDRTVAEVAAARGISIEDAEQRLANTRLALFTARSRRVWPGLDDKVITAWNGLMVRAFAEAAMAFESATYASVTTNAAAFLLDHLRTPEGRLLRTYRAGQAKGEAFLEDYASLALGLLSTYEATFDLRWYSAARELVDQLLARFSDEEELGFYDTARDHEQLVGRPREMTDNATPSGTSLAVEALLWLGALTGEERYRERGARLLATLATAMAQQPLAFGHLLGALERWISPSQEVAIIGDPRSAATQQMIATVRARYRPHAVVACATPGDQASVTAIPLLADRHQIDGLPTAFVCSHFACQLPVTDATALARQLGDDV